jgi:hypothetical protein
MQLFFAPAAQVELDEIFAYLEGEETGLGYRFTADIDEALGRIQLYPKGLASFGAQSATLPPEAFSPWCDLQNPWRSGRNYRYRP